MQVGLLDRLLKIVPPSLSRFFFANSGSEAVDNAIKVARAHTKRQNIICFEVRAPHPGGDPAMPVPRRSVHPQEAGARIGILQQTTLVWDESARSVEHNTTDQYSSRFGCWPAGESAGESATREGVSPGTVAAGRPPVAC